jgi:hypothetical protein
MGHPVLEGSVVFCEWKYFRKGCALLDFALVFLHGQPAGLADRLWRVRVLRLDSS